MRWELPKNGDRRTVRRFAWLPVDLRGDVDGVPVAKCIWWESFTCVEVFSDFGEPRWKQVDVILDESRGTSAPPETLREHMLGCERCREFEGVPCPVGSKLIRELSDKRKGSALPEGASKSTASSGHAPSVEGQE